MPRVKLLSEHMFDTLHPMRCDFCGSLMVKWRYPAERDWLWALVAPNRPGQAPAGARY